MPVTRDSEETQTADGKTVVSGAVSVEVLSSQIVRIRSSINNFLTDATIALEQIKNQVERL